MKQTNNAIKFLMAQYRAIFKNAYFKGLTSAVLLTAGLAAGSAQADDTDLTDDILKSGLDKSYTITGVADAVAPNYTKMTIDSAVTGFNGTINITSSGQATQNIISGAGSLTGNGSIVINTKQYKYETNVFPGLRVEGNTASQEVKVDIGSVNLQIGSLSLAPTASGATVNFNADQITIGSSNIKDQRAVVNLGNQATTSDVSGNVTFGRVATTTEKGTILTLAGRGGIQMNGSSGASLVNLAADTIIMNGGTIRATKLATSTAGKNQITSHQVTMNAGNLEVEDSGSLTLDLTARKALDSNGLALTTGEDIAGRFDVLGGNVKLTNGLTVANGTLSIADAAVLTATSGDNTSGSITVSGSAGKTPVLELSAQKLTSFLAADEAIKGTTDIAGGVLLSGTGTNNGTLHISDSADKLVDIAAYKFSGSNTVQAGMISVSGAGLIQGQNLAISHELTQTGATGAAAADVSGALTVKADTLTLGGGTNFDSSAHAIGVKQMTAKNVVFKADAANGDAFTLQDNLRLVATQEITNPYDASLGTVTYAGTGTIDGDVIVSGGNTKSLMIRAGHYTTNDDITISGSGSKIAINNQQDYKTIDTSLTLGSASTLTLNDGALLVVNGKQATDINFGDNRTRKAEVYADISDAKLLATGTTLNKLQANSGTLIMDEDQLAYVLKVDSASNDSNAAITLENNAIVEVEGDIKGLGNTGLDVTQLKSGATSAATSGTITFSGTGGTLEATGNIWLKTSAANTHLNLGDSGTLVAESFRLDNTQDISTDDTTTVRTFTVADGTLVAGSSVTTSKNDHNPTLVLGEGTSGASLVLGYIEENTDEWGIGNNTYTTSSDTGSINQNLTLSGSGSTLEVNYGTWTSNKDITVSGTDGVITVGDITERFDTDGNEIRFDAALSANKLTLGGTDSALNINSNGTVTVNGLTMSTGDVNVWGQMTVNGIETEADATDPDHGVAITGGTITVTGRNAQLTFGEEAVKNISVNGDEVTAENFANNITVNGYATLRLDFAEGTSFTEAALKDLRQSLLANATDGLSLDDGYIHLGSGSIRGLALSGGTIDWDNLSQFKDIKDIRTDGLDSATLTNVDETDIITANVGNIQANGNTQNVQLSDTTLNSAKDLGNGTSAFITNANGEIISATVQGGAVVGFNGGGAVKDLVINSDSTGAGNDTVVNIAATGEAVTSFESIRGGEDTILNVDGVTNVAKNLSIDTLNLNHALTVGGDVTIGNGLYSDSENATPASLNTSKLTVTGNTYFDGNITASQRASFDSSSERDQVTYLAGNNTFNGGVEFLGGDDTFVELSTGTTTTTDLALTNGVDLLISNNANVVADNVTVKGTAATGTGTIISVGEVAGKDGTEEWPDSTGYLTTTNLDLNGATLIVDPAYGMATSIAVTDTLGNLTISNNYDEYASGTLHGNLVAARNGIIAVGFNGYDDVTAIEEIQETFATLMDSNGSLQADNVGAIVYLGHNIEVQNGSKIVVDSTKNRDQYLRDVAVAGTYATNVSGSDVYIAKNSALAVDKNALSQVYNGDTKAAIHFEKDAASLYNDGGKIILTGDDFRTSDTIKLFTDNGGTGHDGILIKGQNLEVATLNGLLHFYLNAGEETTGKTLTLNYDQVDHVFNDASAPVKNSLIAYAAKDNNWDGDKADPLHGAVKSNIQTTDGKTYTNKADGTPVADSSNLMSLLNADGTTYTVYEKPNNYFLEEVVRGFSGADAETVARLGVFGGAAQAAIAAGSSTYDAVSGRMGVGANGANITVADNTQGAALWLAPIYKSSDSDGFDAEGVDYGVDMDLYGVALGADYTLSNGIRFGAMFNVGSGDIDGQGAGSAVSNDFDYYGFAVYGGYSMGALSLVADVSYTVADNDLEGNTSIDKVGASLDSTNLSIGVTGQYQLDFNGTTVTPHAGLRFSRIDLDDYTIDGEDVIADYDADSMNIFSIPVGVTFAKEFTGDAWTVKPSLDLTLTGNFGDDETDGTVHWAGVDNLSTNVSSEVLDNFTYGATLGVAAKTGNFSLGLGVNYTGSSNVDEFGVNANARFVF